jgi:hypothetical protein
MTSKITEAGGSGYAFLSSLIHLSMKKGSEVVRYAKIEPFMDLYVDPEWFGFHDKSNKQNRYITLQEIAFVGCRITTSALNNGYRTHLISYDTFLTKWRADYKKFTDLSPTRHKLVQIVKILNKYNIIRQTKRGSSTPIYTIGVNNPYHPDYKPVKTQSPEIGNKAGSKQTQSPHLENTPKRLQAESDTLDMEFENILTSNKERK